MSRANDDAERSDEEELALMSYADEEEERRA
jgi:hypothetical protein